MVCGDLVLAMTSPCDADDALNRLAVALQEIDAAASAAPAQTVSHPAPPPPGEAMCTIARALAQPAVPCPMAEAEGRVAAEFLWAYPPGVPLIVPGERVTRRVLEACHRLTDRGTALRHTGGTGPDSLLVLQN